MASISVGATQSPVRFEDLDLPADAKEAFKNSSELNILIFGKYHVGKSTLINSLFYREGEEYVKRATEGNLEPTTKEVESYKIEMHGVSCNIFDTQGLQDGSGNDSKYLKKMKRECKTPHLVICCIKLDEPVRPEDVKTIKAFTGKHGAKIWENALFALTFANQVEPARPRINEVEFLRQRVKDKTSYLRECLKTKRSDNGIGIDVSVVEQIQFVPTGTARRMNLPGITDWRINFWEKCFLVMKQEARFATLKIHWRDRRFIAMIFDLISRGKLMETGHIIKKVITDMGWYTHEPAMLRH